MSSNLLIYQTDYKVTSSYNAVIGTKRFEKRRLSESELRKQAMKRARKEAELNSDSKFPVHKELKAVAFLLL